MAEKYSNDGYGWGSEFRRIEDILEDPDIRKGKLLSANSYLIDVRALFAAALVKMWAEPYAFITDISAKGLSQNNLCRLRRIFLRECKVLQHLSKIRRIVGYVTDFCPVLSEKKTSKMCRLF